MGKAAKVLHGREHRVPAADGYDTQLQKKALLKVAFWNEDTPAITTCRSRRFVTDIESKWVYSHIKLSSNFRYVLI